MFPFLVSMLMFWHLYHKQSVISRFDGIWPVPDINQIILLGCCICISIICRPWQSAEWTSKLLKPYVFTANITLEIYLVQYVLIDIVKIHLYFPANWIVLTTYYFVRSRIAFTVQADHRQKLICWRKYLLQLQQTYGKPQGRWKCLSPVYGSVRKNRLIKIKSLVMRYIFSSMRTKNCLVIIGCRNCHRKWIISQPSYRKVTNLKYIQLTSAGVDRVPTDHVKAHKIIKMLKRL